VARATKRKTRAAPKRRRRLEIVELAEAAPGRADTSPVLTGGDVDADWSRAHMAGDEAVGGSVATPDQDVVDELGRALGVEQAEDAEVRTSEEILRDRDRLRWRLEREAPGDNAPRAAGRPTRRRARAADGGKR